MLKYFQIFIRYIIAWGEPPIYDFPCNFMHRSSQSISWLHYH